MWAQVEVWCDVLPLPLPLVREIGSVKQRDVPVALLGERGRLRWNRGIKDVLLEVLSPSFPTADRKIHNFRKAKPLF